MNQFVTVPRVAPLDANLATGHWKDAVQVCLKAKDKPRALAAAKTSAEAGPKKRGDLLLHFWHHSFGQVFLETGKSNLAIEHLEAAITTTTIFADLALPVRSEDSTHTTALRSFESFAEELLQRGGFDLLDLGEADLH